MLDARELGELLLERRDLRTHDPLAALDRRQNGFVQRFAEAAALGLKIDKGMGAAMIYLPQKEAGRFRRRRREEQRMGAHNMLPIASAGRFPHG